MVIKKIKKRKVTRDYLVRATYSYLQKFATTEKNLKDVLERKVRRIMAVSDDNVSIEHGQLFENTQEWIDDIVAQMVSLNLVNDREYAESRARSLIRNGNSKVMIIQKLRTKGVPSGLIDDIISNLSEQLEDQDALAAVRYIKKRRFGAFNSRHDNSEIIEKELASMCRAGFSYTLGHRTLGMAREELEEILYDKKL
ncbi:MAG: RecX family transcriptional regulator [Emcibacter sp.]|nr:RecX family transcriptional regulator [Emcibacter sp.]